jgi:hypothetical protein
MRAKLSTWLWDVPDIKKSCAISLYSRRTLDPSTNGAADMITKSNDFTQMLNDTAPN